MKYLCIKIKLKVETKQFTPLNFYCNKQFTCGSIFQVFIIIRFLSLLKCLICLTIALGQQHVSKHVRTGCPSVSHTCSRVYIRNIALMTRHSTHLVTTIQTASQEQALSACHYLRNLFLRNN